MEVVELFSTPEMSIYLCVLAGVLGLVMGSFLTCAAGRMVAGESFLTGRSHCDACNRELDALDLIPVLSWLFSRGRCRHCGAHLSALYPVSELVCALMYVSIVAHFGFSGTTLEYLILASVLFCVAMTDLLGYIIPNGLVLFGIGAWALLRVCFAFAGVEQPVEAITSGLVSALVISVPVLLLALVLERLRGKAALGGGDVKLLFMVGLYFSWPLALLGLFLACVIGIVIGVAGRGVLAQQGEDEAASPVVPATPASPVVPAAPAAPAVAAPTASPTTPAEHASPAVPAAPVSPATPSISSETAKSTTQNVEKPVSSALIPFGTAIAIAFWITICEGMQILGWYLALF